MIPILPSSKDQRPIMNFPGFKGNSGLSHDAQITRTIRSFYLLAKSVVSKISDIEKKKKKLILVVDDEPLTFQLIEEMLQEANLNFEIQTATSSERGLEIAIATKPDLIITDWLLPEVDGVELIRKLKAEHTTNEIPVILVTGMIATNEELDTILQAGALDYLKKPLDYGELSARVKAALALGDSLKEIKHQKESLRIKDQFVNFLIEAAPNPIFYQDKEGRFLGCNKHFEQLFRRTKNEIIGKLASDFLSKGVYEKLELHFASLRESGFIQKFEIELPLAEGNKHLLFLFSGFGNSTIDGVIGSITDVTEIIQSSRDTLTQLEITHKNEKDQITSSVERLTTELDFKHREVAMHLELLIHSRNVKEKLVEGVNKLQPFLNNEGKSKLFSLLEQLQWELSEEVDLNIEKKFDETNSGFYALLEQGCPEITKNEKRLCAFLKMNHGASDIAKITDKSLNSINVALARLRTKLQLPNTKDLRAYLNEFDLAARDMV